MYRKHCVRIGRRARGGNSDNTEAAVQRADARAATAAEDAAPHDDPEAEGAGPEAIDCTRAAP